MNDEVNLDYVARKSGVSAATASRALNGRAGVAEDVRDRVRMVADSLDYRPNRAAKNLAGGRSSVIGLVLGSDQLRTDPYASSLVQSIASAAEHYDEGLMLLTTTKEPGQAVRNILRDGLVDGVVVSAVAIGERWVEELLDANVSTVLVGSHPDRSNVHVIDVENLESSAAMVGHLLDSGCTRVGTMTGPLHRVDARLRLEGFRLAHIRRGAPIDESLIVNGDFTQATGFTLADELLDKQPDAIFAANDEMCLGIARAALAREIAIPAELSLAGFDGTSIAEPNGLAITTVMQPFDELAMMAVGSLVSILKNEVVQLVQLVEPQLRFRETTRTPEQVPQ